MKHLLHGLGLLCGACCVLPADFNAQIVEEVGRGLVALLASEYTLRAVAVVHPIGVN